jgi:hypothetical protein
MSAEHLIALEAAVAELGTLYTVARGFTALQAAAEGELLPQVSALGSRLRALVRDARLSQTEIDAAARDVLALRSQWRAALEELRTSSLYQHTLRAHADDRQADLARLVPGVFAGLRCVQPASALYFPVSPASGRRRPNASPFLDAPECASRLASLVADGLQPDLSGSEWWDTDLPWLLCADTIAALETPLALRLQPGEVRVAVFAAADDPTYRVFTPRLRAAFEVVAATEATDEWWEAYEESYGSFRHSLAGELAAHGVPLLSP